MASYEEIAQLYAKRVLKNKLAVAIAVAAEAILQEADTVANHTQRYAWAAKAMGQPNQEADRFLIGVLAANKDVQAAQIEAATDTAIQNNVDGLVDVFALADASGVV